MTLEAVFLLTVPGMFYSDLFTSSAQYTE